MPQFYFNGRGYGMWDFGDHGGYDSCRSISHDTYFDLIIHYLPDREEQLLAIMREKMAELPEADRAAAERAEVEKVAAKRMAAERAVAAQAAAEWEAKAQWLRAEAFDLIETTLYAEHGPRDLVSLLRLCAEKAKAMAEAEKEEAVVTTAAEKEAEEKEEGAIEEKEEKEEAAEEEVVAEEEEAEEAAEEDAVAEEEEEERAEEEETAEEEEEAEETAEEEEAEEAAEGEAVDEAAEEAMVPAGHKRARGGKNEQSKRQKQSRPAGLPTNTAELLAAIAENDLGVSTDRSSTLAKPALTAHDKIAGPDEQVKHKRGSSLPDGFRIVMAL